MVYFYLCPVVTYQTPHGTTSPVGKVYAHRASGERYTFHRGLGQAVICSLENPSIETQANIAGDQECVEWPDLDALWITEVGMSRRAAIVEILNAHGVPMAWPDALTTAGEVLSLALQQSVLQQQGKVAAIAKHAVSANAETDLLYAIRRERVPVVIQGVRLYEK